MTDAVDPAGVLDRYGIRTVILRALYDDSGRILPVVPWLAAHAGWVPVRASDGLVFVRREDFGAPGLGRDAIWRYVLWETDVAEAEEPGRPHLDYSRGMAYLGLGEAGQARASFRRALARHPEWAARYAGPMAIAGVPVP